VKTHCVLRRFASLLQAFSSEDSFSFEKRKQKFSTLVGDADSALWKGVGATAGRPYYLS
jgi:hypothetical protein